MPHAPQIVQPNPGSCPICGMRLEQKTQGIRGGDDDELSDMSRRFWLGLLLSLPILLIVNFRLLPNQYGSWAQLALATPVVLWPCLKLG